jgi:hypothetical protein
VCQGRICTSYDANAVFAAAAEAAGGPGAACRVLRDESEALYSWVTPAEVVRIVHSHSSGDVDAVAAWTRSAREGSHARRGNVAERIARLRELRARTGRE